MDMVDLLANDCREKEEALPVRLEEIKNRRAATQDFPEEYLERFEETIEHWKKYSESKARLKSTYSPSATWSSYAYLEDKIKSIDDLLETLS